MCPDKDFLSPCPNLIAIVGGGRWARVLIEVLSVIVSNDTIITIHSLHNYQAMLAWVLQNKFRQNVTVYADLPKFDKHTIGAMIVVNAARDHESAIEKGLNACVPVLVEKPVTLSYTATLRLAKLARKKQTLFAPAHIFLFTRYLFNFSDLVNSSGKIKSIQIDWADPKLEKRYGEHKYFDQGLPIFFDCLPHVLSIISVVTKEKSIKCTNLVLHKGGSDIEIKLMLGDIFCDIRLIRNSNARKRTINVTANQQLQLDFTKEPGVINNGTSIVSGDHKWTTGERPAAQMLSAFLTQSAGGRPDARLDIGQGLCANELIDEVSHFYNQALFLWLKDKLFSPVLMDDDLQYALREILLVDGHLSDDIEPCIKRIQSEFSGKTADYWYERLNKDSKPYDVIRRIASGN